MKNKNKTQIFKAVGLLLCLLIIANTVTAVENKVTVSYCRNKKINTLVIKNIVFGTGSMGYMFPDNLDNFDGDYWYEEYGTGFNEGVKGWIKNTDIIVGNYLTPSTSGWILIVIPRIILPRGCILKNFSGWVYCDYNFAYHGTWDVQFTIIGVCDGVQKNL